VRELREELLDVLADGEWWTQNELRKPKAEGGVGADRDKVKAELDEMTIAGLLEFAVGPEGRRNDSKCWRLKWREAADATYATSPESGSQGEAEKRSGVVASPIGRRHLTPLRSTLNVTPLKWRRKVTPLERGRPSRQPRRDPLPHRPTRARLAAPSGRRALPRLPDDRPARLQPAGDSRARLPGRTRALYLRRTQQSALAAWRPSGPRRSSATVNEEATCRLRKFGLDGGA